MREESPEVLYADTDVVSMQEKDIEWLKKSAKENSRERIRLCAHDSITDATHEMIIVHMRDCYVRPHLHRGKSESFHVIEGKADILLFDQNGNIEEIVRMASNDAESCFFYRLNQAKFHTLIIRSEFFVFHEVTSGPFCREDTVFAEWAPEESKHSEVATYYQSLIQAAQRYFETGL